MSEWNDRARITVDSVSWGQLWWEVLEAWAASVIGSRCSDRAVLGAARLETTRCR